MDAEIECEIHRFVSMIVIVLLPAKYANAYRYTHELNKSLFEF